MERREADESARVYTVEDQEFLSTVIESYSPSAVPLVFSTSPSLAYIPPPSSTAVPSTALLSSSPTALFTPQSSSSSEINGALPPGANPSQDIQHMLVNGMKMLKIPNKSSSRPKERVIKVDLMPLQLSWESKKKGLSSTLDFHSIREIRLGQNTKAFDLHGRSVDFEGRAFSIIYRAEGDYKILNLVAPSREICAMWVYGIHTLIFQMNDPMMDLSHLEFSMSSFLKRLWQMVDVKNSGRLNLDEVTGLLAKLNIRLSKSEVKSTFKNANLSKLEVINYAAFERLYRILRFRPEISEVFSSLTSSDPSVLSLGEFKDFIVHTQKMQNWNDEKILDYYTKYTPSGGQMDMDHFSAFLISANNSIFKKEHTALYQDMSQPLSHYFINSSHNTYLLGDQLAGESSLEGYIRALQSGCRCIELDCWDGPIGAPIIYHGHSLTNRLSLREVCETIAKYAFSASDFPLILSLEVHCTVEQQDIMAVLFREIFKDTLVTTRSPDECTLPSPESLRRKILLKGKIVTSPRNSESDSESPEAVTLPNSDGLSKKNSWMSLTKLIPGSEATPSPTTRESPSTIEPSKSIVRKGSRRRLGPSKLVELIVYLKKVHFDGFPLPDPRYDEMFSFSEKRAVGLIQKSFSEFREYNHSCLSRVYPAGIRVTSSNFNPLPHWLVGSQIVALNYQTYDKNMQVNQAFFEANGQCGYILKPPSIHEDSQTTSRSPVHLNIKVISAQQLPKARGSISNTVIDPSVDVEIIGVSSDNAKYRTRSISSNGFNPVWKQEFTFKIEVPEMAFLRFQVQDSSNLVGSFSIHLPNLEQGYRHVPLYDWKGHLMRFSSLFVYIQKQTPYLLEDRL